MTKKLPRVAAVHDVSGYGKCALTVAMPVISAAGVEVCPVPTAILSTNTLFDNFTFFDYTPHMRAHFDHWRQLGLKFDCVYSGFLGSIEQIDYVLELIEGFDSGISVIDPVMGDNGIVIKTYTPAMCEKMVSLVAKADIATPNITEACLLTGCEYKEAELNSAEAQQLCEQIIALGCKNVVLTGVRRGSKLYNCAYEQGGGYFEIAINLLPYNMHGTGDLFTSVLVSGLMRGYGLRQCVDSAARFVYDAMEYGRDIEDIFDRGVAFEPIVYRLGSGLYQKG
ncbi:MAG: pyridoxamine kinase [Bacillota bacterium]|nr:pyridoxamine kinase [Bacillota bacterium]